MDCVITESLVCRLCGKPASSQVVRRNCLSAVQDSPAPGLGDRVAAVLDAIGITKERVQAAANAVGVKDCGCAGRQAALNAWGHAHLGMPSGGVQMPGREMGSGGLKPE